MYAPLLLVGLLLKGVKALATKYLCLAGPLKQIKKAKKLDRIDVKMLLFTM